MADNSPRIARRRYRSSRGHGSDPLDPQIRLTYLSLRLGLVVLALLLVVSVLLVWLSADRRALSSLSAYYYTAARPIFLGALIGIGASLIAYRGNTEFENVVLDVAGFFAFVIALIPTAPDEGDCSYCFEMDPSEVSMSIQNNLLALLVGVVVAVVVGEIIAGRKLPGLEAPPKEARVVQVVEVVLIILAAVWFFVDQPRFEEHGHNYAAGIFFAGIVVAVFANAYDLEVQSDDGHRGLEKFGHSLINRYGWIGIAMVLSIPIAWAIAGVFLLELVAIAIFGVFWFTQTLELGGKVDRAEPDPEPESPSSDELPAKT